MFSLDRPLDFSNCATSILTRRVVISTQVLSFESIAYPIIQKRTFNSLVFGSAAGSAAADRLNYNTLKRLSHR